MITAKEALKLSRECSEYEEKLQYYTEIVDKGIRDAAKKRQRWTMFVIDNFDVVETIAEELLNNKFDVIYECGHTNTIVVISW